MITSFKQLKIKMARLFQKTSFYFSKKNEKGLTIIEMLAAMFIFSLIIGGVMGVFFSAIRVQRKTLAYQELLSQTSYVMEYMGRALRMAKKDEITIIVNGIPVTNNCFDGEKANYAITYSLATGRCVTFRNYKNECQQFCLRGTRIKEIKEGVGNYLTSPDFEVVSFNIGSFGWGQYDYLQPRVTLFLRTREIGIVPGHQAEIKIQTTVSQRDLDIRR